MTAPIEARLRTAVHLTFTVDQFSNVMHGLVQDRQLPGPSPFMLDPDRGRRVDFSRVSKRILNMPMEPRYKLAPCASPQRLRENLDNLQTMIRRIESHGGHVALVSLPVTGARGEMERAICPREQYWDVMAATTSAVTLNWMDDPRLRKFKCPDGSHLDMRDQVEFTRLVVEDLLEKLRTQRR